MATSKPEHGNWRSSPAFYIVPKKYRAGPKSIQTPVIFRPPAGRNPDWSITMIFMQLTTQLIHYHVLICIIICYKPKGNIVVFLSPLRELKKTILSLLKHLDQVLIAIILFLMKGYLCK